MPKERIDPRKLTWVRRPKLYIQTADKVIMETEPNTHSNFRGDPAESACGMFIHPGRDYSLSFRMDFNFHGPGDQCGFHLYTDENNWCSCRIVNMDRAMHDMACTVCYDGKKDRNHRQIGSGIRWMYWQILYYRSQVKIQFSFNGDRYLDFRQFEMPGSGDSTVILYACSLKNTYYDCTVSRILLQNPLNESQFYKEEVL